MLRDTIDIEYRNFVADNQTNPSILVLPPDLLAELIEELDLDPLEEFSLYHGMEIHVDDIDGIELHSYASFQTR